MGLNCKPKQLCRVLRGEFAHTIVETQYICKCLGGIVLNKWTVVLMQSVTIDGNRHPPGSEACVADGNLKPLGGEGHDERDKLVEPTREGVEA